MKIENADKQEKKFNNLIQEFSRQNQSAVEEFCSLYGKFIFSVAVSITKSEPLAEEILNDIVIKLWNLSPTLKYIEKPFGWLRTVTANSAKDRLKTEKQCSEIFDLAQDDENIERLLMKDAFLSYISPLSESEQEIIILHHLQNFTFEDIARELDKPLSTVTSSYYRSKTKLKEILK